MPTVRQQEILEAVRDTDWQLFRISLKGLKTAEKLDRLVEYILYEPSEVRRQRVDNYLKALARGGQLYPQPTIELLMNGLLAIRKEI